MTRRLAIALGITLIVIHVFSGCVTSTAPTSSPAIPPPHSTKASAQKIYFRSTYDSDASHLIGRFIPNEVVAPRLEEGMAVQTSCSAFIRHRSVSMSGTYEAIVREGNEVRRVQRTYESKLVADVDMEGFQACCLAHPDQCPRRYIDSVIKGEIFVRSGSQGSETRKEMQGPQYFGFTVAATPLPGQRTAEAVNASAIEQLLSHIPSEDAPIPVAIEPVSRIGRAESIARSQWVYRLMAAELSRRSEHFLLKEMPAARKSGPGSALPPGVRLLLSLQISDNGSELEIIWSARLADPTHGVRLIQLKPVSIAMNLVPKHLRTSRTAPQSTHLPQKQYGRQGFRHSYSNSHTPPAPSPAPRIAATRKENSISRIVALTAGNNHSCALLETGSVMCWGENEYGQLGNGYQSYNSEPEPVHVITDRYNPSSILTGVKAISAGGYHTCALMETGSVMCWGQNRSGQVGFWRKDGGRLTLGPQTTPVQVYGLGSGAISVFSGPWHTCALMETGSVMCWASKRYRPRPPVEVPGLGSGITAITSGSIAESSEADACAFLEKGRFKCWEVNDFKFVRAPGLNSGVMAIAHGEDHTCTLMKTGGVRCWGDNSKCQLGNGKTITSPTPVNVLGLSTGVLAIAAGSYHTCALMETGGVKCWGDSYSEYEGQPPVDIVFK